MKPVVVSGLAILVALSLSITGCTQSAPAAPTAAPVAKTAEATKPAAEPTKAQAAPTSASTPAPKVNFPEPGKTITLLVPYPAGGGSDLAVRLLQPYFEKEIGVPVQVVNKGGATTQVGMTELVNAKKDGYTIGHAAFPILSTIYFDEERKAAFSRKDFQPVAMHVTDPMAFAVKADSPYKTAKDLVEAAKAKPNTIKVGTSGPLSVEDFGFRVVEKQGGAKFNYVTFDGSGPGNTALAGGHIDAFGGGISSQLPLARGGKTRLIATFAPEGKQIVPELTTLEEQGFKGAFPVTKVWVVPTGTPMSVVNILTEAFKKAEANPEYTKKLLENGQFSTYLNVNEVNAYWDKTDAFVKPLMEEIKKEKVQ